MKFPKKLYVVVENDGENEFLMAAKDPSDFAEKGVAVQAAEYQLVKKGVIIKTKVTVK